MASLRADDDDVNDRLAPRAPSLWFRVLLPGGALGPGKIMLLRLIAETGSVAAAARRLRMSHARSVKLVAELNALGREPMIQTKAGGEAGGGSALTDHGRAVLALYAQLDEALNQASQAPLARLATRISGG